LSDELDRLFELLVRVLAQDARLALPFPAADIHERLVPYRSNRSRLNVATHQDYEMTVLRLLAGERGYVGLQPEEVREAMQRETTAPNPDPGVFRNFPDARVAVNRFAAERFLRGELAYAPPDEQPQPPPETPPIPAFTLDAPPPETAFELEERPDALQPNHCPYCGGSVPAGRKVNFCPHCGQNLSVKQCPACSTELEVEWQYCITCGRQVD